MSRTSTEVQVESISLSSISLPPAIHVEADPAHFNGPAHAETSRGPRDNGERSEATALPRDGDISKAVTAAIITSVTCVTGISSLLSGLVTVSMPTIAEDLALDDSLLLWYVARIRDPCSTAFRTILAAQTDPWDYCIGPLRYLL